MVRRSGRSSVRSVGRGLAPLLGLAAVVSVASCREPSRTGLLVLVRAHDFPAAPPAFDSLRIEIEDVMAMRQVHMQTYRDVNAASLESTPFDFSLVPTTEGAPQLLRVKVTAIDRGADVISAQAVTRYLPYQVRRLDIDLWNPCRTSAGVVCPDVAGQMDPTLRYQTCVARLADPASAHCENAYRDPGTLDRINADGSVSPGDAVVREDAPADAPGDGGADAPSEASADAAIDVAIDAAPDVATDAADARSDVAPDVIVPPDVPSPPDVVTVDVVDVLPPMDVPIVMDAQPEASPDAAIDVQDVQDVQDVTDVQDTGVPEGGGACMPPGEPSATCAPLPGASTCLGASVSLRSNCVNAGDSISVALGRPTPSPPFFYAAAWIERASDACGGRVFARRYATSGDSAPAFSEIDSMVLELSSRTLENRVAVQVVNTGGKYQVAWLEQVGVRVMVKSRSFNETITGGGGLTSEVELFSEPGALGVGARLFFAHVPSSDFASPSTGPETHTVGCFQASATSPIRCFAARHEGDSVRTVAMHMLPPDLRLFGASYAGNPMMSGLPFSVLAGRLMGTGVDFVRYDWSQGDAPRMVASYPIMGAVPSLDSVSAVLGPPDCPMPGPSMTPPVWAVAYAVTGSSPDYRVARLDTGAVSPTVTIAGNTPGALARTSISLIDGECAYAVGALNGAGRGAVTLVPRALRGGRLFATTQSLASSIPGGPIAAVVGGHAPIGMPPSTVAGMPPSMIYRPDLFGLAYFQGDGGSSSVPVLTMRWAGGMNCQ